MPGCDPFRNSIRAEVIELFMSANATQSHHAGYRENDLRRPLDKRRQQRHRGLDLSGEHRRRVFEFVSKMGHSIIKDSVKSIPIRVPVDTEGA
jgi:hypothetical protein